ncbi:hypothetical protein OEB99_04270 [Actinotalea sp. M2MS4P-6]|uniref:hypothetical protein n=1 Tax=Actinotalea sp. M2MS4P-6 TaxID=2983762 RepID=UPI0021E4C832|nr:hypothetical protein [Actinotalea sp. M2MS4P-6]MCV2393515.1 hypothetical protein [Actinotalea sp. M2MS4P-6]
MLVDAGRAVDLGTRTLGPSGPAVVYVDREVREPGDVVVGPRTHSLTSPALLVFRDEMPGANWLHPCTYALVDAQSGELVLTVPADRPPVFGRLPETWVVAVDPEGRADLAPP